MSVQFSGACLCGAVKVTASVKRGVPEMTACHCDMCRRQNSGPFLSLSFDQASIEVSGETRSYTSSEWASRGFCPACGSTLWYSPSADGSRYLAAGLFDDACGATLAQEFFTDHCPQGYALAGDHPKLSAKETLALFAPEGEA